MTIGLLLFGYFEDYFQPNSDMQSQHYSERFDCGHWWSPPTDVWGKGCLKNCVKQQMGYTYYNLNIQYGMRT